MRASESNGFTRKGYDGLLVEPAPRLESNDVRKHDKRDRRPGGRFILMEHGASPLRLVRVFQKALDWIAVRTEGDHLVREPLVHLKAEGFLIEGIERLKWGIVERLAARKAPAGSH